MLVLLSVRLVATSHNAWRPPKSPESLSHFAFAGRGNRSQEDVQTSGAWRLTSNGRLEKRTFSGIRGLRRSQRETSRSDRLRLYNI